MKNQVKKLRIKLDLTQEQLAEKLGVTRQTIISIEKGSGMVSFQFFYFGSGKWIIIALIQDIF